MSSNCWVGFLLSVMAVGVLACGKDEPVPDAVRFDFGELHTDASGHAVRFAADGERIRALATPGTQSLRPDTTYRAIVSYVSLGDAIRALQIVRVPVYFAQAIPQFHFRGDPVRWVAGWRGGRYLNLRLDLPGSFGAKHSLAFAQRPPVVWPDGRRTAVVWLYHDAHGDRNDYFQDTYLNLALSPYIESSRERFDSIALFVNTLHGPERRAFPL